MEKPDQPGAAPSARQTAPQQREPQIGAQQRERRRPKQYRPFPPRRRGNTGSRA